MGVIDSHHSPTPFVDACTNARIAFSDVVAQRGPSRVDFGFDRIILGSAVGVPDVRLGALSFAWVRVAVFASVLSWEGLSLSDASRREVFIWE